MNNKICKKCNINKDLSSFYKCKTNIDGYENSCKDCRNKQINTSAKNNPERVKKAAKKWRNNNKEYNKKRGLLWRKANPDKVKEANVNFNIKNPDYKKNYEINRRKENPLYKLKHNILSCLYTQLKRGNYTKKSRTYQILTCSFEELKLYIELQWEPWMNWKNHGLYNGELNYGWDIDHIIPTSSAKNEIDFLKLWNFTNLKPLCSKINRDIKKDKLFF
jgi:hypothetical protein